jgi:iron(II)-dependent oxidoreductase
VTQDFDGVEMALVPVGCFTMGSADGDDDEQPGHEQCLGASFWIDVYEVTNAQFAAFLNAAGNQPEGALGFLWLDVETGDVRIQQAEDGNWAPIASYEFHPVTRVSWYGAANYCAHRRARLPSEAEWEYAARGPDSLIFPWGDTFDLGNTVASANDTAEVGTKPGGASWVGALDMSGNVWEWVNSRYRPYPYDATDGREADGTDHSNESRVLRGGSFSTGSAATVTNRSSGNPFLSYEFVGGFRCARDDSMAVGFVVR